jgi:hypothetical protein
VPSLRELQERFYAAMTSSDVSALARSVLPNEIGARARIEVYRNNAREGFRKALLADYPVIGELVGAECFRGLAHAYMREHPSRSGDLQSFGREFATFLARRYGGGEFDYLADIARLEWACQEALVAAEVDAIGIERLARLAPDRLEHVSLRLHPAARLVRSPYPILRIWQQHQSGADRQTRIDLASGGEAVLVGRLQDEVELHRLPAAEWTFLAALNRGAALGDAVDAALAEDDAFDLERALARAFTLELVVDCSPDEPRFAFN